MSFYTRQRLFADRLLGFDDVLSEFYGWAPIIERCWLAAFVFEPESSVGKEARSLLEHLWRVHLIICPARRAQRRAYDRQKKREYRAAKRGEQTVSPLDGPTGEKSALEVSADEGLEEPSFGYRTTEDAALDAYEVSALLNEVPELAVQCLNEKELQILGVIAADPECKSSEIAEYLGMPVEEVYWRRSRMKQKLARNLKSLFPEADL